MDGLRRFGREGFAANVLCFLWRAGYHVCYARARRATTMGKATREGQLKASMVGRGAAIPKSEFGKGMVGGLDQHRAHTLRPGKGQAAGAVGGRSEGEQLGDGGSQRTDGSRKQFAGRLMVTVMVTVVVLVVDMWERWEWEMR